MTAQEGVGIVAAMLLAAIVGILAGVAAGVHWGRARALGVVRRLVTSARRERDEHARRYEALSALQAALIDAVPGAVIEVDADLRVQGTNALAREWFALTDDDAPSLMAATRSLELVERLRAADRASDEGTIRIRDRSVRVRVAPVTGGGRVVSFTDESRIEQLERARRDLVANISHDLRTPLASLGLLSEALIDRPPRANRDVRLLVEQIQAQVAVLRTLADGVVELSRVEEGRAHFRLVPIPASELIDQAATNLAPQLKEAGVTIDVVVPADLIVLADRHAVLRALANVLDNAVRVSPPGGVIRVTAEAARETDRAVLRIADEGPGIPPSERERVFERFFRGDPARGGSGAGLGLAIVRHVVRGHGGEVEIEDTAGPGACVRLTLPRGGG